MHKLKNFVKLGMFAYVLIITGTSYGMDWTDVHLDGNEESPNPAITFTKQDLANAKILFLAIQREITQLQTEAFELTHDDTSGCCPKKYLSSTLTNEQTNLLSHALNAVLQKSKTSLVTIKAYNDFTPLHLAAYYGDSNAIRVLLQTYNEKDRVTAVNVAIRDGLTPLHCAASKGDIPSIIALLHVDGTPLLKYTAHEDGSHGHSPVGKAKFWCKCKATHLLERAKNAYDFDGGNGGLRVFLQRYELNMNTTRSCCCILF